MKPFGLPSPLQLRGLLELVCLVVLPASAAAAQGAPQGRSVKILDRRARRHRTRSYSVDVDSQACIAQRRHENRQRGGSVAGSHSERRDHCRLEDRFQDYDKEAGLSDFAGCRCCGQTHADISGNGDGDRRHPGYAEHGQAGQAVDHPAARQPVRQFEFIAQPPAGVGMFVALLCDKPVQVVDLPTRRRRLSPPATR